MLPAKVENDTLLVIVSMDQHRTKLGQRTIPNRHCEGAPRLWQSLRPEALTNFCQILVLNREHSFPNDSTDRGNPLRPEAFSRIDGFVVPLVKNAYLDMIYKILTTSIFQSNSHAKIFSALRIDAGGRMAF